MKYIILIHTAENLNRPVQFLLSSNQWILLFAMITDTLYILLPFVTLWTALSRYIPSVLIRIFIFCFLPIHRPFFRQAQS